MENKIHNICKLDNINLLGDFIKIHNIDINENVEKVYIKGRNSLKYFEFIGNKHNAFTTRPYIIYDTCETKIPKEWKSDKDFTIVPFYISSEVGNHQNVLLIDWNKKIVERFEPLAISTFDKICDVNIMLYKMFDGFTIITSNEKLPIQKYQELETRDIKDGLCIGWCCWYVDMRLTFKNMSSNEIITKSFYELNNGCGLTSFIVKYLNYLYKNTYK